jgi:hypothetical protein
VTVPTATVPTVPDLTEDDETERVTAPVRRTPSTTEPETSTTSTSTTSTTAVATATPTDDGLRPADGATGDAAPQAEPGPTGLAAALELLTEVAAVAAKESSFPGSLLLVIALFLIAQDRIDRKDPKLALAPTHRESALGFSEDGGEQ